MRKKIFCLTTLIFAFATFAGCSLKGGQGEKQRKLVTYAEAENGSFSGNVKAATGKENYSGDGFVTGFEQDEDSCEVAISVPKDGFYDLVFLIQSKGGRKENTVFVDGVKVFPPKALEHMVDSREKLEADVLKYYTHTTSTLMWPEEANIKTKWVSVSMDTVLEWLDRAADIR